MKTVTTPFDRYIMFSNLKHELALQGYHLNARRSYLTKNEAMVCSREQNKHTGEPRCVLIASFDNHLWLS